MKKQTFFKGSLSKGVERTVILKPLVSLLKQGLSLKASKLAGENHSPKLLGVVGMVPGNNGSCVSCKTDNSDFLWLCLMTALSDV